MKKLLCSVLFACLLISAPAQSFFVYIESAEPFFVKINERTYSSGNAGYLILSGLADRQPDFRIGFPENRFPDQLFNLPLDGNDHGFRLQNSNEGWGLVDLQTSRTVSAARMSSAFRMEPRVVSPFTEILSRATDDPSLRFTIIRLQPEPAAVTPSEEAKRVQTGSPSAALQSSPDSVSTVQSGSPSSATQTAVDSVRNTAANAGEVPVAVIKTNGVQPERKQPDTSPLDTTGRVWDGLTVAPDSVTSNTDPIKNIKPGASETAGVKTADLPLAGYTRSVVTKKSESSTTAGFGLTFIDDSGNGRDTIEILIPNAGNSVRLEPSSPDGTTVAAPLPVNCRSVVTDADVNRSVRRARSASGESAILGEIAKLVKSKCITTGQVRTLAGLFPGDGGRLKLFELVFPKAADPVNFVQLESELKDEYFITRFRSLLR